MLDPDAICVLVIWFGAEQAASLKNLPVPESLERFNVLAGF